MGQYDKKPAFGGRASLVFLSNVRVLFYQGRYIVEKQLGVIDSNPQRLATLRVAPYGRKYYLTAM